MLNADILRVVMALRTGHLHVLSVCLLFDSVGTSLKKALWGYYAVLVAKLTSHHLTTTDLNS